MSPSIREGNAWPRVVMADLEEGEIEEGELPVTEPEVGQPSQIVPNCAAMVVCIFNPRDLTSRWSAGPPCYGTSFASACRLRKSSNSFL